MKQTKMVKAKKVKEGDFLPGLDHGYVFEDPDRDTQVRVGQYAVPDNYVLITYHDGLGGENYLVLHKNTPLTVERDVK